MTIMYGQLIWDLQYNNMFEIRWCNNKPFLEIMFGFNFIQFVKSIDYWFLLLIVCISSTFRCCFSHSFHQKLLLWIYTKLCALYFYTIWHVIFTIPCFLPSSTNSFHFNSKIVQMDIFYIGAFMDEVLTTPRRPGIWERNLPLANEERPEWSIQITP